MLLDKNLKDRNYLYGRLYAIADYFDVTNKGYLMQNFRVTPCRCWKYFYVRILPKLNSLDDSTRNYFEKLIEEIHDKFTPETYLMYNSRGTELSLNGMYIMGYHNQSVEIKQYMQQIKKELKEV